MVRAVLGIDAAWTAKEPSGVALAVETKAGWRLAAVESSYERFVAAAGEALPANRRPLGSVVGASALIDAAAKMGGDVVELIAVDMPLSPDPITGRRECDNHISRLFGARKAAVYSPSAARPGKIADDFREAFGALGFPLCVSNPARGLIEVYPHAALIAFLRAPERLPYKVQRTGAYWRGLPIRDRRAKLRETWGRILVELDRRVDGVADALLVPGDEDSGWRLKAFEDKLDAVVCAATAIACLNGEAEAHGDHAGAIWVPIQAPDRAS